MKGRKNEDQINEIMKELSELTDLVVFQAHVGKRAKYGRKPHPTDSWGYTKELLEKYGDSENLAEIVRLFAEVGAMDEVKSALWVASNIRRVK